MTLPSGPGSPLGGRQQQQPDDDDFEDTNDGTQDLRKRTPPLLNGVLLWPWRSSVQTTKSCARAAVQAKLGGGASNHATTQHRPCKHTRA